MIYCHKSVCTNNESCLLNVFIRRNDKGLNYNVGSFEILSNSNVPRFSSMFMNHLKTFESVHNLIWILIYEWVNYLCRSNYKFFQPQQNSIMSVKSGFKFTVTSLSIWFAITIEVVCAMCPLTMRQKSARSIFKSHFLICCFVRVLESQCI